MKTLDVAFLRFLSHAPIETASAAMNAVERHKIDQQPWREFAYKPDVDFSIAHAGSTLFPKYFVSESTVRAFYFRPNEPVYKDSCVEFFLSLNDDQ